MNITLSIMMLAAIALLAGAAFAWLKRGERKQASLMALLALIMIANIAIWTVPDDSGNAPLDGVEE
jgi:drug/metabolite transporter superfamily protein YnfA